GSTAFTVDELRISNVALSDAAVAYDAARSAPFADNEVMLPMAGVSSGPLNYAVSGCGSAMYNFTGVPINNFNPPNGLLPPGSATIRLSFNTLQPTTCRYSIGTEMDYSSMQVLDIGPPTAAHTAFVTDLSADPRTLSHLYVRCASNNDYLQSAVYRVVAAPAGSFPRVGNMLAGDYINRNTPDLAAKTQLFLGAATASAPSGIVGMSASAADALRALHPNVLILATVEVTDDFSLTLPESYYLHDTHGNRISQWCDPNSPSYVYNMTRPEVARYVAELAYQELAQFNWAFDGMFFDVFGTHFPANVINCQGNSVQVDSDGNGQPDDQAQLDVAWSAGMYLLVSTFHSLAPGAYISGHVEDMPAQPQSLAAFNGSAIEFYPQDVREGQMSFGSLWDLHESWETRSVSPTITMVQSAPPTRSLTVTVITH